MPDIVKEHGRSSLYTRAGEIQELFEEGSRRIVTGDCPMNAGKDVLAMDEGKEKRKRGTSVFVHQDRPKYN